MPRLLLRLFAAIAICLSLALFLSLILTPDPVGNMFFRALNLENRGAIPQALGRYELIAQRHPNSPYAPRALAREAELLEARGKQSSDAPTLRRAAAIYQHLAKSYPDNPESPAALQSAGELATKNLNDRPLARAIYSQILEQNGETTEVGAEALVQLARLQIQDGQGKEAQKVLQGVIRKWNGNSKVGAQAQYFLGMCYETLFKNRDWARRAYDQVIAQYPSSEWATQAKVQLGLLEFAGRRGPPTRRVLLDIAPLPDENDAQTPDDSVWSALRVALAVRGLSGDPVLSRGYSLAPFYAGLNVNDPGKTVEPPFDVWENAVGAAGYRYSIKGGGREDEALRDLQDELNAAHVPLVFWQRDGKPTWSVCVGYDSERGEVMLQNRGAQFDTLAAKAWAASWKIPSEFGKPFTLISLVPSGQGKNPTANPSLTPTPLPTPLPNQTPAPIIEGPPAFVWQIAPLKEAAPVRRTARRAAIMLARNGTPEQLLGAQALDLWTQTLDGAAREARAPIAAPLSPTPIPTPVPTATPDSSIYDPAPAPTSAPSPRPVAPVAVPHPLLERAARLWPFWGAPAQDWIDKRREAANWCRMAALKTGDAPLNSAAKAFDASADALQRALQDATAVDASRLGDDPQALKTIAKSCRAARDAERQATRFLGAE
jgi:tetratricopeptide (TPR) repeat protein